MFKQFTFWSLLLFPVIGFSQITAISGDNVNVNGGGKLISGDVASRHIAMDTDDIQCKSGDSNATLYLNFYGGNVNIANAFADGSSDVSIGANSANEGTLNAYNTLYVKGDTDRIGIGTSSPDNKLHVKDGNIRIQAAAPNIFFTDNNNDNLGTFGSILSTILLQNQATGQLADIFMTTENGKLKLEDNGRLAIGDEPSAAADIHLKQTGREDNNGGGMMFENSEDADAWKIYMSGLHFSFADWVGGDMNRRAYIENNTGDYVQPSDKNKKEDIKEITDVLDQVNQLRPVEYRYKTASKNANKTIGFIAQEVAEVLPDLVHYDENNEPGLAYSQFGVIAIRAIQELQTVVTEKHETVENLTVENTKLQTKIAQLETQLADVASLVEYRLAEMEENLQSCCFSSNLDELSNQLVTLPAVEDQAILKQNTPNPFNAQSVINYYLPTTANDAFLQITDLQGRMIESVEVVEKGAGQITLSAGQLAAGSYFYTLIVDGEIIATKKMVLTK